MKGKQKRWAAVALSAMLALPAMALAVTEGVVEAAPDVELNVSLPAPTPDPAFYVPDPSYYGQEGSIIVEPSWSETEAYTDLPLYGDYFYDMAQGPGLTNGEIARAKKLLAAYQAGEATGDGASVLNATENVTVGVYALDPAQYDGEQAYVILPGTCLTDEQLLAIIDAYHQLGLTFDPESLTYRNNMRGGVIENARFLTDEEHERYYALHDMIERGVLDISDVTPAKRILLDERYFFGLPRFNLLPYRSMTDEEIVALLVSYGIKPIEADVVQIERTARDILAGRLGQPLSMMMAGYTEGGEYIPRTYDENGEMDDEALMRQESRTLYTIGFFYTKEDGIEAYAYCMFDMETGALITAAVVDSDPNIEAKLELENQGVDDSITAEMALATATAYAQSLGHTGLTWHVASDTDTNWGVCFNIGAKLNQDEWLFIRVGRDDGQVHGVEIEASGRFAK